MEIGIVGTRGIPARYGGFENCAEEISKRLAKRGHSIFVACRRYLYPEFVNGVRSCVLRLGSVGVYPRRHQEMSPTDYFHCGKGLPTLTPTRGYTTSENWGQVFTFDISEWVNGETGGRRFLLKFTPVCNKQGQE